GFDGIELSRFAVPSLTTVGQEDLESGAVAWSLLQSRLQRSGPLDSTEDIEFEPRLITGDSTGRVPPSRKPAPAGVQNIVGTQEVDLENTPLGWVREGRDWTLLHGGRLLTAAVTGASMALVHSPRPHLHPVRSLTGRAMTLTNPMDHRHHFGVSMALPDVNGTTFWGGRTFIEGRGPTLLTNHGRQESQAEETADNGRDLRSQVRWRTHEGEDLLLEDRRLAAFLLPEHNAWGLAWRSRLHANAGELRFTSPANRGRLGAGYGGLFWRLPGADETRILVDDGQGESAAHGSVSPFILVQQRHANAWTSLLLAQNEQAQGRIDPWFVRASDYVGIGTSLAWDRPRTVASGDTLDVRVRTALLDYRADPSEVPAIIAAMPPVDDELLEPTP